jgi:hypothetical protein
LVAGSSVKDVMCLSAQRAMAESTRHRDQGYTQNRGNSERASVMCRCRSRARTPRSQAHQLAGVLRSTTNGQAQVAAIDRHWRRSGRWVWCQCADGCCWTV